MTSPEIIAKAAEALAESVASIINDPCATEQEKREALAVSFAQAECFLKEELPVEALAKSVIASANPAIAFENADGTRMTFPHKRALAMWLAIQRVTKTEKELPMKNDTWQRIAKDHGIVAVAKMITTEGAAPSSLDEHTFTQLLVEYAKGEARPGESPEGAFSRIFCGNDDIGLTLRRAHTLCKYWPAPVSIEPVMTGGTAAFPSTARRPGSSPERKTDPADGLGNAYAQLTQHAEQQRRAGETAAAAFERVYLDPANRHLAEAERAENRPAGGARVVG